jgi:chemotaxis protein methyltransferase WspC
MNLAPLEALLKEAIGLDVASIGAPAVESVIRALAKDCDGDWRVYLDRVRSEPGELRRLIDAVVVPETWFFRDRGAFAVLARQVRSDRRAGTERLRLLSIPCASGEEAYSIAITLLEARLSRDRFEIDALDVSPRQIELAATAVYGKNAFRGDDGASLRNRYFAHAGGGFHLSEAIRSCVRFDVGNLLDPDLLDRVAYDVVFCRNLLIYFDEATQDRAILALTRLIRPGGLLFVGPPETNLVLGRGFAPVKASMAFAFRKEIAPAAPAASAMASRSRDRVASVPSSRQAVPPDPDARRRVSAAGTAPGAAFVPAAGGLPEIQRMADAGHLAEAARLCQIHIENIGPSANALALLALIRDAAGSAPAAIELYRKALYLDPHHEAALAHLALRLERDGDGVGAARLKERMRRAGGRTAK